MFETLEPCAIAGNEDMYGLGVRLGFYLQWMASILANALMVRDELQSLRFATYVQDKMAAGICYAMSSGSKGKNTKTLPPPSRPPHHWSDSLPPTARPPWEARPGYAALVRRSHDGHRGTLNPGVGGAAGPADIERGEQGVCLSRTRPTSAGSMSGSSSSSDSDDSSVAEAPKGLWERVISVMARTVGT